MIAPTRIRCRVIAIPVSKDLGTRSGGPRPSEMLPWADPYIAGLIQKLQAEVRNERREAHQWDDAPGSDDEWAGCDLTAFEMGEFDLDDDCFAEAEWPWNDEQYEFDPGEEEYVPDFDDRGGDASPL